MNRKCELNGWKRSRVKGTASKALVLGGIALCGASAWAEPASQEALQELKVGLDTVFVLFSAMLVFLMQAGFALIESGTVRSKNAVNVMMKNYTDVCVGSIAFWLVGYGLMMGANETGWVGTSHFLPTELADWDWTVLLFQMMFASTAVTIASGAMAERVRFGGYLIGSIVICAVIYPVFASWVWGGAHGGAGWLADMGFIDFAGSTVVHSVGGWIALGGALALGPRLGRFSPDGESRYIPGHNMTSVALGGFLLWFGWFAFNAGSNLRADQSLGLIVLNTQIGASAGAVGTMVLCWLLGRPILLTRTVNGSLGGLVAVTAGCATMSPVAAAISGAVASLFIVFGEQFLNRIRVDDAVGAVPVHAFCGAWGTLAAGMFYQSDWFNIERMVVQGLGVCMAFIWTFCTAYTMYLLLNKFGKGLRASTQDEQRGLDFTEHAEVGYPEFQQDALYSRKNLEERRG